MSQTDQIQALLSSARRLSGAQDRLAGVRHPLARPVMDLLRRVSIQLEQAVAHLTQAERELDAAVAEIASLQQRQIELLEASGPCVVTGAGGVILQANTAALLLLRASAADLGRQRLQQFAPEAESLIASLDDGEPALTAELGIGTRTPAAPRPIQTVVTRVAGQERWRWLFRPCNLPQASGIQPDDWRTGA